MSSDRNIHLSGRGAERDLSLYVCVETDQTVYCVCVCVCLVEGGGGQVFQSEDCMKGPESEGVIPTAYQKILLSARMK